MRFLFIFFFIFSNFLIYAQETHYTISGKVISKINGSPLPGASVFAQNTTFGVATDAEGNFRLRIPNGGYVIVITFSGYETETMRINNSMSEQGPISISMRPKEKSMEEVSIVATNEIKDGWIKYGQLFKNNFIGNTEFGQQTFVSNPEALKFYYSKKRNRLKVLSSEPLIVKNDALGYVIKFAIDSFSYEYNTNTSQFIGYPLFEVMHGTPAQENKWNENRVLAYHGSLLHFMRSLYNQTLDEEGFQVQLLVKNNDKDQAIILKNMYAALNYSKDDSSHTVEFSPNQPNIVVIYKNAKPETAFLEFDQKSNPDYQVSILTVNPDEFIFIEQNGYYYEQTNLVLNGYMAFEKVGNMLPYDYSL